LGEDNTGRQRVGHRRHLDAVASTADPRAEGAESHRAPDAEAAVPDLQRVDGMLTLAEVILIVGNDVVEPRSHKAEWHRPNGDVGDLAGDSIATAPRMDSVVRR